MVRVSGLRNPIFARRIRWLVDTQARGWQNYRVPGLPADYDPNKSSGWIKAVRRVAKALRPVVNRVTAPVKGPQTYASDRLEKFLEDQKGKTVVKLQLARKPINSKVKKALDLSASADFKKGERTQL